MKKPITLQTRTVSDEQKHILNWVHTQVFPSLWDGYRGFVLLTGFRCCYSLSMHRALWGQVSDTSCVGWKVKRCPAAWHRAAHTYRHILCRLKGEKVSSSLTQSCTHVQALPKEKRGQGTCLVTLGCSSQRAGYFAVFFLFIEVARQMIWSLEFKVCMDRRIIQVQMSSLAETVHETDTPFGDMAKKEWPRACCPLMK